MHGRFDIYLVCSHIFFLSPKLSPGFKVVLVEE